MNSQSHQPRHRSAAPVAIDRARPLAGLIGLLLACALVLTGLGTLFPASATEGGAEQPAGSVPSLADQKKVDEDDTRVVRMTVDKWIGQSGTEHKDLTAGTPFQYLITNSCTQNHCVNATIADALPAELAGFPLSELDVFITEQGGGEVPVGPEHITWFENGVELAGKPDVVGSATSFVVRLPQEIVYMGDGDDPQSITGVGQRAGTTASVVIPLQVPNDFSPMDPRNGLDKIITNRAVTEADNAAAVYDEATVAVYVEPKLNLTTSKTWSPNARTTHVGALSTITLKATNTSTVPVHKLVVQDPDGTPAPAADSSFRVIDFKEFTKVTFPEGATQLAVEIFREGQSDWEALGAPIANADGAVREADLSALNAAAAANGIAGQIIGVRYVFTSAVDQNDITIGIQPGAAAEMVFTGTQRRERRDDDYDLLWLGATADEDGNHSGGTDLSQKNTSRATISREGCEENWCADKSKGAESTHKIQALNPKTEIAKTIQPNVVPAGEPVDITLHAKNTGSAVSYWEITDLTPDFWDKVEFVGFTDRVKVPTAWQNQAKVVYTCAPQNAGGSNYEAEVPFGNVASTSVMAPPADCDVKGFKMVFWSVDNKPNQNTISQHTTATIKFQVKTKAQLELDEENNVATSKVQAFAGQTWQAKSDATLSTVIPGVDQQLTKTIKPSGNVRVGESVLAALVSTTTATNGSTQTDGALNTYALPKTIVIEDTRANATGDRKMWDAFNLTSIETTEVPAGADMVLKVQVGDQWVEIASMDRDDPERFFRLSPEEYAAALAAAGVTGGADAVTGVQFTFTNPDSFPARQVIKPNLGFTARGTLRGTETPTDVTGSEADDAKRTGTRYTNTAIATGCITDDICDDDADNSSVGIIIPKGDGVGPTLSKSWDRLSVISQSQAEVNQPSTRLNWKTLTKDNTTLKVSDPAVTIGADGVPGSLPATKDSVYDSFNLVGLKPIAAPVDLNPDTPTSEWHLKWDTIESIEFYYDGEWNDATNLPVLNDARPGEKFQNRDGSFPGYTLTKDERTKATGVMITLKPSIERRQEMEAVCALDAASPDCAFNHPKSTDGVSSGDSWRTFELQWEVRDYTRTSADSAEKVWVTDDAVLNLGADSPGAVRNWFGV